MFNYIRSKMSDKLGMSAKSNLKKIYSEQNILPRLIDEADIPDQEIDDYYVKLQIVIQDERKKNKNTRLEQKQSSQEFSLSDDLVEGYQKTELLDIAHVFDSVKENPIKHVLVTGKAGVGKTTLMHYITYKWAKQELWNDQFTRMFRIKLRDLTNPSWQDGYKKFLDQSNPSRSDFLLPCFIHYCIGDKRKGKIEIERIINIDHKKYSNTLLLIDGYDEITHLVNSDNPDIMIIKDIIFECPNIIMTSRPNALSINDRKKFNVRLDNIGLDNKGIKKYAAAYFKDVPEKGQELLKFLDENRAFKQICTTPINMCLVCLIWSKGNIKTTFNSETTISALYSDIIYWMGQRYLEKFEKNHNVGNELKESVLSHPIILFMKDLAHIALDTGRLVIDTKLIGEKLGEYEERIKAKFLESSRDKIFPIALVNKFGLLKAESQESDLGKQPHSFIHLTFQEWMTAYYIQEQLVSTDSSELQKAVKYISEKSDETRYLMTMKFLSGLLSSLPADEQKKDQVAINSFWNAIISSNDQILRIGGNKQVELLMHLLPQALINGEIDPRIPAKIIEHVDSIILENIYEWGNILIDTQYSSSSIINELIKRLNSDSKQEIIYSMKILANLRTKIEDKQIILTSIKEKLSNTDIDIEEAAIYALGNFISYEAVLEELLSKLASPNDRILIVTLEVLGKVGTNKILPKILEKLNHNHSWVVISAVEAIENIDESSSEVINSLINKLSYQGLNRQLIVERTFKALSNFGLEKDSLILDLLNQFQSPRDTTHLENIIDILGNIVSIDDQAVDLMLKKFNSMIFILNASLSTKVKMLNALNSILIREESNSIKAGNAEKIVELFVTKLRKDKNDIIKITIIKCIAKIAKVRADLLQQAGVDALVASLSDSDSDVRKAAVNAIGEIAKVRADLLNMDAILLNLGDSDEYVRYSAANGIGKIAKVRADLLNMDAILLNLGDSDRYVRKAASIAIGEIAEVGADLLQQVGVDALVSKLGDNDSDVRKAASIAIGEIAKARADLLQQAGVDSLVAKLGDKDSDVRKAAVNAFSEIAKVRADLLQQAGVDSLVAKLRDSDFDCYVRKLDVIGEIAKVRADLLQQAGVDSLVAKLGDSDFNCYLRQAAIIAIIKIARVRADLLQQGVVDALVSKLGDSDSAWQVRQAASIAIGEIAKVRADLLQQGVVDALVSKLGDSDSAWQVRQAASIAIVEIAKSRADLLQQEGVDALVSKLGDSDSDVREAASTAIGEIAKSRADLLNSDALTMKLGDSNSDVRKASSIVIGEIVKVRADLLNIDALIMKLGDYDWFVREAAVNAIAEIAKSRADLLNMDSLVAELGNSDLFVRQAASIAIGEIAKVRADLLQQRGVDVLVAKLGDSDSNVREAAVNAIGEIAKVRADLLQQAGVDALVAKLGDSDSNVRKAASIAIVEIAKSRVDLLQQAGVDALVAKLGDSNHDVREAAVNAIGEIAKVRADLLNMDALVAKSCDSDWQVRLAASRAIGEIAKSRADLLQQGGVNALVAKLDDNDRDVRQAASIAIVEIAKSRADLLNMDALVAKLGDKDSDLRKAAAEAIGEIAKVRADLLQQRGVDELLIKLGHSDSDIRKAAVNAIGAIDKSRADLLDMDALLLKLGHSDSDIRKAAANACRIIAEKNSDMIEELLDYRSSNKDYKEIIDGILEGVP